MTHEELKKILFAHSASSSTDIRGHSVFYLNGKTFCLYNEKTKQVYISSFKPKWIALKCLTADFFLKIIENYYKQRKESIIQWSLHRLNKDFT